VSITAIHRIGATAPAMGRNRSNCQSFICLDGQSFICSFQEEFHQ
jgi:hypothetical protein